MPLGSQVPLLLSGFWAVFEALIELTHLWGLLPTPKVSSHLHPLAYLPLLITNVCSKHRLFGAGRRP